MRLISWLYCQCLWFFYRAFSILWITWSIFHFIIHTSWIFSFPVLPSWEIIHFRNTLENFLDVNVFQTFNIWIESISYLRNLSFYQIHALFLLNVDFLFDERNVPLWPLSSSDEEVHFPLTIGKEDGESFLYVFWILLVLEGYLLSLQWCLWRWKLKSAERWRLNFN